MSASNNVAGQNKGATQQVNQQTTQALQRLMQYLSNNPSPLQGAPNPQAPQQFAANSGTGQVAPVTGQAGLAQQRLDSMDRAAMNPSQIQQLMTALASQQQKPMG